MKVLQINATYGGSTGKIMCELAEVLNQNGHQCFFATPFSTNKYDVSSTYTIGGAFDHRLHAFLSRAMGKQGYFSKRATKGLLNWIDKISPDVIITHNLHSNYININLLFDYIAKKRIKTLAVMHDCWLFTGKCFHFLYSGCEKWRNGCGGCPQLKLEQPSLFFDKTARVLADKQEYIGNNDNVQIIAVSEWLADLSRQSILKDRPTSVIRNGIDLDTFKYYSSAREELGIDSDRFVILGMGNKWLAPYNRELLTKVISTLKDDEQLIIVGCSNEKICESNDKVKYVGKLNHSELVKYYSAADVFVNATKADSLPTVNMESVACGTPVVTYASGGSPELVSEGKTGYIVKFGDIDGIIEAIGAVKRDTRTFYHDSCVEYAKEEFDKKNNFLKYLSQLG